LSASSTSPVTGWVSIKPHPINSGYEAFYQKAPKVNDVGGCVAAASNVLV
jgi:hypothetical protein